MSKNINQAFYLKYRPQTLKDLIGQEGIKETLFASYKGNKLSHAYLFVGPRGTGKTSTARILAKMVNCEGKGESGKGEVPCNKCSTCVSITDGSNLDLIEIDAASNRGIEDIRALREKIKLAPTSSKKKVYIIDEVHMLTSEAFNALLKTLEEPPNHALFIMATTEVSKIPQTILSRSQRLDFKLATHMELRQALERIIKEEKIDIEGEAIQTLIKKADGSFRDAVKLLDQVATLGKKITNDILLVTLSSSKFDDLIGVIETLAKKKIQESLMTVQKQIDKGLDVKELMVSLMDILRSLMLIKNGVGQHLVKPQYTQENYQKLVEISEQFGTNNLIDALDVLQDALEKLKFALIPQLPLEIAVVEICGEQTNKTIDDGKLKIEVEGRSSNIEKQEEIHPPSSGIKDPPSILNHPPSSSDSPDILLLKEKWTYVLETIRPFNFSLEALLRSINIRECNETGVVLEVPYSFHQRILEAPKNRDLLESVLSDILGRQVKVVTVLGNRPKRLEDVVNIEVAQDDEIIRIASEIFNSDSIN
ncbi:DNA polymerase III subunit gamma/tau [Candidatus Microgenomates bacterium]|nr:DNA polymerase III subunit gamma/tau [Candidatus Microgenomates bacterium]